MIVAPASGSVGETIAPSANATAQGMSGISSWATERDRAHRHQHEPIAVIVMAAGPARRSPRLAKNAAP